MRTGRYNPDAPKSVAKLVGYADYRHDCDACGRGGLEGTIVLDVMDRERFYGSDCAAEALRITNPAALVRRAKQLEAARIRKSYASLQVTAPEMIALRQYKPEAMATAEQVEGARVAIDRLLSTERWYDARAFAAARYDMVLKGCNDSYRDTTYEFELKPRGGEVFDWNESNKGVRYPKPKNVIDTIPEDPACAYRGMSWEEWQSALASGEVKSIGEHNFENQKGLTFYAPEPGTAESYAGGFSPWMHQPADGMPGVIIAVKRAGMLEAKDMPGVIPGGELAADFSVDVEDIKKVWYLVPTEVKPGRLDVIVDKYTGKVSEGSRYSPSVRYAIVEGT